MSADKKEKKYVIDKLTQFLIGKSGKEKLVETVERAGEQNRNITVCLYDINLLKEVNESYGYMEGDRIIATIAGQVRASLGESEFAFRLSGDEFVIVFQCEQKEAGRRIDQIRNRILELGEGAKMNFCFGLAEYTPEKPISARELLLLADGRMYEQQRELRIKYKEELLEKGEVGHALLFHYDKDRLYDALVQSTEDYLYVCNMKTGIFKYTKEMVEEFDLPGEIIENAATVWGNKVHPDDKAAFLESNQEILDGRATNHCVEYRAINKRGEWVWVRCRGYLVRDEFGEPSLFAGFITNLGKKNKIDQLTGLFNKLEFREQMEHLFATGQSFAVMLLGIDDLKHINDLYNRTFGDEVIRIVSQKILSLLPSTAMVYRMDGDAFGVVVRGATQSEMEMLYRTIYYSLENQHLFNGKKYYCTLSGGCVLCPGDANTYEDAVKYVNYCMDFSKKNGKKRCTYFSKDILTQRTRNLTMVELLRESVEDNFRGFRLVFQPLVQADSGELSGAEALARWSCDEFGSVSPLEFIPLLEESGLIVEVGKWILKTAVATTKKWIAKNPDFVIDVNLSYVQIQESDFFKYLRVVMEEQAFFPRNLVLELTESYFIKESDKIKSVFREIRGMGVRIAMDDFGTGYSTLGILKESPADIVKIDKTFIRGISTSEFDATFIRFVVELCHNVGIKVCLEGVETQETYEVVRPMGLDLIQGYLFDRPLEEAVFTKQYFGNK